MNSFTKTLAFCALLGASGGAQAITLGVDPTQTWLGYMKWYELPANGGAFKSGGGWGFADLKAAFSGGSLTLKAAPIGDPASPYWYVSPGGPGVAGNNIMEALAYVEQTGPLSGQSVTFSGTVQANTWVSGYETVAFIEDFAPDYSSSVLQTVPLTNGSFSVTLNTIANPARHVQYGFRTKGPNVWPTDVDSKGSIQIQAVTPPIVPFIPNGDFEIAGGAQWGTTQGTPSFPANNGNPNGNAVLDGTVGFAVLYAFNNSEKTFASLGLAPGQAYTVQMDMKILNGGTNIGGLRLEGPAGYVIEQYPAIVGDGSAWATYSINLTVPNSPQQAKFGLRPGDGSIVAFDNVKIVLPPPPGAPASSIATGNIISWAAGSNVNTYQPQKSEDDSTWVDIGIPLAGNAVSSRFSLGQSPYYQVLEITPPTIGNGVTNPGFEDSASELSPWSTVPQNGISTASSESGYLAYLPVAGSRFLKLEAENLENPIPPAEIGVRSNLMTVTGGTSYTLNFSAAVPELGTSFVAGCRLRYFNQSGFVVDSASTQFSASAWTVFAVPFTPPAGITSVEVNFFLTSGAVPNVKAVCLIDNVSLLTAIEPGEVFILSATVAPAVEVTWDTLSGSSYQVKSSPDLSTWSDFGSSVIGTGSPFSVVDPISTNTKKFYRILQTIP